MKQIARMRNLEKRNCLSDRQVAEKSWKIAAYFFELPEAKKAKTMMVYVGVKKEARTAELIKQLLSEGKRIAVPLTDFKKKEIVLSELKDINELEEKPHGLLEPKQGAVRALQPSEIDLVVVPGVAFDRQGTRIGTGYGFYDKLLRKIPSKVPLVGFCFEENLDEQLPRESHDVRMTVIITDKQVLRLA
jgi:5-formyltetrahydrofolate cyclo-ligase